MAATLLPALSWTSTVSYSPDLELIEAANSVSRMTYTPVRIVLDYDPEQNLRIIW